MEKLELKHLAPYLPYKLNLERINYKNERFKKLTAYDLCPDGEIDNIKPILRPIEDLYNEKTDFGIKIVHYFNFKTNVKLDYRNFPYHVMEQLFKNHFDVFGLIPKGLAISYLDVQSTLNEG